MEWRGGGTKIDPHEIGGGEQGKGLYLPSENSCGCFEFCMRACYSRTVI